MFAALSRQQNQRRIFFTALDSGDAQSSPANVTERPSLRVIDKSVATGAYISFQVHHEANKHGSASQRQYHLMALNIHNAEAFAKHIEKVVENSGMSYMDAILDFCERRQLDPEAVVPFISDKIKRALAREGRALHLLPKRGTLPIEEA